MCSCAAFGLLFMEMVKDTEEDDRSGKFNIRFLFVAFLVNVAAALFSLSCISIAAMCIALLVIAAYTLVFVIVASPGELGLSTLAAIIILGAVVGFLHFVAYPDNRIHDCTEKIFEGPWMSQEEKAERTALVGAAWRMFGDNAIGGVGASCYGTESGYPKYFGNKDWAALKDTDVRHWRCGNDFAQLLAEYGVVGTFLLLAPFVALAFMVLARIWMLFRYGTKYKQGMKSTTATEADRIGVFEIMPPDALALFVGAAVATGLSFFVPVFGSQLNIYTWAVFFVVASASLPKPRRTIFKQGRQ
jgi:O-antigen ligase